MGKTDGDARNSIIQQLEALNKAMPEHRKIDGQVRGLKAEIHTLNARLVSSDSTFDAGEFARIVERGLASW